MGWGRGRGGQKRGRKTKEMDAGTSDLSSEPTKSGSGEESTIRPEEKEGGSGGGGSFFACYLLTSLSPRHKGQTYIGFTVNPRRRIRQHNGEISSGAFRTKKKRPWEMVLCIYGFPTNISALQFEWAWQHPKESINVREAAATMKSISGLANKIKLAYKMLNLPAWNSLNMTVNIFSSKYTIHSAGIDLPKHMKSQICSMDELPCFSDENGGGFFDDYNHDELNGEDDEVSDKNETHNREDDVGNDKENSPSKALSSSLRRGEKVWLTDEAIFELSDDDDNQMKSQICSMDELPCYTDENGCGSYVDYNHAELSDKNETHIGEDDDGDDKDDPPSETLSSSLHRGDKVCLTDETFFELSDDDNDDEKHMQSQICSMDKFPCYTDVTTAHENGDHDELNDETHIREDDDGGKDISSSKTSSSTLCEGKKRVWLTEETFFELSDDDNMHCVSPVDKTHEVDVIDLLSPSPFNRAETCSNKKNKKKKMRIMTNVYPHDIIDLTKSPAFV